LRNAQSNFEAIKKSATWELLLEMRNFSMPVFNSYTSSMPGKMLTGRLINNCISTDLLHGDGKYAKVCQLGQCYGLIPALHEAMQPIIFQFVCCKMRLFAAQNIL
jgi:hypothetical protein